jgi:hypothetical protein
VAEGNKETDSEGNCSGLDEWLVVIKYHAEWTNVVFFSEKIWFALIILLFTV